VGSTSGYFSPEPRAVDILTDDHVATIYEAYQADIYLSLEDFRRKVARCRTHWVITKRNDLEAVFRFKET
jgi:hypothetical protein